MKTDFNKKYGKSWNEYFDKTFIIILFSTLTITLINILIIANKDYSSINKSLSEKIIRDYINTLFSDIKIDLPSAVFDSTEYQSNINLRSDTYSNMKDNLPGKVNNNSNSNISESDLNFEDIPESLVAIKDRGRSNIIARPIKPTPKSSVDITTSNKYDPWVAPIQRQGEINIEPIDEIVRGSQHVKGWRNPDEITLVIQAKEQMIEHCFKREAKFFNDMHGYVLVRFIILHSGIIDPSSIKIVKSTLHNKQIELCIKKRIQSWRGFEELDSNMGSVAVVQKFIFN